MGNTPPGEQVSIHIAFINTNLCSKYVTRFIKAKIWNISELKCRGGELESHDMTRVGL